MKHFKFIKSKVSFSTGLSCFVQYKRLYFRGLCYYFRRLIAIMQDNVVPNQNKFYSKKNVRSRLTQYIVDLDSRFLVDLVRKRIKVHRLHVKIRNSVATHIIIFRMTVLVLKDNCLLCSRPTSDSRVCENVSLTTQMFQLFPKHFHKI